MAKYGEKKDREGKQAGEKPRLGGGRKNISNSPEDPITAKGRRKRAGKNRTRLG